MNEFDEDKWTQEQRQLDGRIASDVEGLAGSCWSHGMAGGAPEAWVNASRDTAKAIRAQVARLTNAKRRAHWEAELAALGLPRAPEPKPAPEAPVEPPKGGKAKDG